MKLNRATQYGSYLNFNMNFNMKFLLLISSFLIFTNLNQASANSSFTCNYLFEDNLSHLDRAIELENQLIQLQKTSEEFNREYGRQIDHELPNLTDSLYQLVENLDASHAQLSFQQLKKRIDSVKEQQVIFLERLRNTSFTKLAEDPRLAVYDIPYKVSGLDPGLKTVTFSKKVIEEIFWSKNKLLIRASNLIIRALLKGRMGPTDHSGIVPFRIDPTIYKVKISGANVGAIRVVGYFNKSDFYIVTWGNKSSHGAKYSTQLTEPVNKIRKLRNH